MDTRAYVAVILLSSVIAESCPDGYVYGTKNNITKCHECIAPGCLCDNLNNCKGCMNGYFMSGYLCVKCPDKCLNCTAITKCSSCKTGFTGNMCESVICANNECLCNSTLGCDSCKDGFYNSYNNCTYKCQSNCSSCSDNITCDSCTSGMYGTDCRNVCSKGCSDTTCYKNDGSCTCKHNFTGSKCDQCNSGWYGPSCDLKCSVGCHTPQECNQTDGSCVCSDKYMGKICDQCKVGRYGISCDSACSTGCNTTCNQTNGTCSCLNNFTGDLCNECERGMYGQACELNCSRGCNNSTCTITYGSCSCAPNFDGVKCDQCIPGKYGYSCDRLCSNGCNTECNKTDGSCVCSEYYMGKRCDQCKAGRYGHSCDRVCSNGCDKTCNQTDGTCSCSNTFTGALCNECATGMYGKACTFNCSRGCNGTCNRTDGSCACLEQFKGTMCDECEPGWYGSYCESACSLGCNDTCNMTDGTCTCFSNFTGDKCDSCVNGTYGLNCSNECSEGCVDRVCNRTEGSCTCEANFTGDKCDLCVLGKYGENCDFECPSGCLNKVCNRKGECSDGCLQQFYGTVCNQACPVNCKNGISTSTRCESASGRCKFGCIDGFSGNTCEAAIRTSPSGELPITAIAGGAGGGLIVILMIGLIAYCLVRKKNPQPPTEHDNLQELNGLSDGPVYATVQRNHSERNTHNADVTESSRAISNNATVNQHWHTDVHLHPPIPSRLLADEDGLEIDKHEAEARLRAIKFEERGGVYYNCASKLEKSKIRVSELTEFVNSKDKTYFEEEFEKLPKGMTKKYDVSQMSLNMPMNRYRGIYPYDDSRVIVQGGVTDYINASYIDGYKQRHAYIATLGPMSKQLGDFSPFWRMIWQQKVDKIVMVTNFVEEEKDKCEQYFPDVGLTQTYGKIFVKCSSEDEYAEFVMRILNVSMDIEQRTVYHLHFTAWPDKGIPDDVTSIVEFRESVLNTPTVMGGPTVVHCSAGIGRSGTYIALDILIREGEAENMVDIPGCVVNMRHNRPHMVQTAEQYEYLHHALVHALTLGCKPVGIDDCPRN